MGARLHGHPDDSFQSEEELLAPPERTGEYLCSQSLLGDSELGSL